jgi:hypothetical protein
MVYPTTTQYALASTNLEEAYLVWWNASKESRNWAPARDSSEVNMKAVKWLVIVPIVVLLSLLGCSNPSWATPISNTLEPSEIATTRPISSGDPIPPMYANWLKPAKVTISNFYAGAVAEYPITFHNAKQTATEQKRVATGDKDTIAEVPLNSAGLYQNDIRNVIEVASDNPSDLLQVKAYDSHANSLMIVGFVSNSNRIITITYKPMTAYAVYYKLPDVGVVTESARAAQDWVIVANPTLVLAPLETVDDSISLSMPADAKLPDKTWEFWVGVTEVSQTSGTAVSIELVSRWVVQMKG